jgi:hypothetical protein
MPFFFLAESLSGDGFILNLTRCGIDGPKSPTVNAEGYDFSSFAALLH